MQNENNNQNNQNNNTDNNYQVINIENDNYLQLLEELQLRKDALNQTIFRAGREVSEIERHLWNLINGWYPETQLKVCQLHLHDATIHVYPFDGVNANKYINNEIMQDRIKARADRKKQQRMTTTEKVNQ